MVQGNLLRHTANIFVLGLIIHPDEPFLVSTPIKVEGIESEKHAIHVYAVEPLYVTDDTRLYAYLIGTCIFYSIILGTPLLCSQYARWPEEMELFLCAVV